MTNTWQTSKLVELRSKTDRQLIELVTRTLEAAICFARSDDRRRADRACDDVRRLLPFLPKAERRRVEARLNDIDAILRPATHAACF